MSQAIFGLLGVILGSVLAGLKDWLLVRGRRKRDANYAAMRLVCVLDEFFDACVKVVLDDGTEFGHPAGLTDEGQEYHKPTTREPIDIPYPNEIDWKCLKPGLMFRSLSLPNEAIEIDGYIRYLAEFDGPPSNHYFEERQKAYGNLGLKASSLASELRTEYDIPARPSHDWQQDWDPRKRVEQRLAKIETSRKE